LLALINILILKRNGRLAPKEVGAISLLIYDGRAADVPRALRTLSLIIADPLPPPHCWIMNHWFNFKPVQRVAAAIDLLRAKNSNGCSKAASFVLHFKFQKAASLQNGKLQSQKGLFGKCVFFNILIEPSQVKALQSLATSRKSKNATRIGDLDKFTVEIRLEFKNLSLHTTLFTINLTIILAFFKLIN
jgi:hypothetical protein